MDISKILKSGFLTCMHTLKCITVPCKIAFAIFAVVLLCTLIYLAKKGKISPLKAAIGEFTGCYVVFVLIATVFSRTVRSDYFYTLDVFNQYAVRLKTDYSTQMELLLNIFLLLPYGAAAPCLIKKKKALFTILSGFLITCTVECLQLLLQRGTFEIVDIINNTVGTALGVLIYYIIRKIYICAKRKNA